jgi:hypothetical protein
LYKEIYLRHGCVQANWSIHPAMVLQFLPWEIYCAQRFVVKQVVDAE